MTAGLTPVGTSQAGPAYELYISCPTFTEYTGEVEPCPVKGIDDMDIMGSPAVAVNPLRPSHIMIASLHGGDGDGPTNRSRSGQVFTNFLSTDYGKTWGDNPYIPPGEVSDAFGEHPEIEVDNLGRVYVGSLYSVPDDDGYYYQVWAQKFRSIQDAGAYDVGSRAEHNAAGLDPVFPGNHIDQFWFLFDNASRSMNIIWSEHLPPKSPLPAAKAVDAALPGLGGLVQGAAEENVESADAPAEPNAMSTIGMVWTGQELNTKYTYWNASTVVGPCSKTTNPVLAAGKIYIGCVVDPTEAPYKWNPKALKGQLDIFRFAPKGGPPEYLGTAPLDPGGDPKLGVRADGRLAVAQTMIDGGQIRLTVAFGRATALDNMFWELPRQFGGDLMKLVPGKRVLKVDIQDLMYREPSGAIQMIIKFRYDPLGFDITKPETIAMSQYDKYLVALEENHGFLKAMNLHIGDLVNRTSFVGLQPFGQNAKESADVFDDLADDIYQLPPGTVGNFSHGDHSFPKDYQREFYAVADYGIVNFAEIVEVTEMRYLPLGPVVPPVPIPTPGIALAGVAAGAAGLAVAGLFTLRFALRRTKAVAVAMSK